MRDMSDGLDRKIDPRDSAALQEIRPSSPTSRVLLKPAKRDVLCGRGAPIQSHEGNVRMREIVSKYARRYMEARKYRKQLIAEDALLAVKTSSHDKTKPVRFLKKVDGENFWEEVDDKIACDKVQHTLRNFVRKLEGKGGEQSSIASEGSGSVNEVGEKPRHNLSQSRRLPINDTLDRSSLGIDALRRTNPLNMYLGHGGGSLLPGMHPALLPPQQYDPASAGSSQMAAEADLQYRLSLRRMSTEDLIRLVAAERAERAQRQALALDNHPSTSIVAAPIAPVAQFGQQDFQRMPSPATVGLGAQEQRRHTVSAVEAGKDQHDSEPSSSNTKD